MDVNFDQYYARNPLIDVLLESKVEVNVREFALNIFPTLHYKNFEPSEVKKILDNRATHLLAEPLSYSIFLNIVKKNLSVLKKTTTFNDRKKIATALRDRNIAQLGQEERYNLIQMTFHRIGQFFRYGTFCTKGELGIKIAKELTTVDTAKNDYKRIFVITNKFIAKQADTQCDDVNDLLRDPFIKLINKAIFSQPANYTFSDTDTKGIFFLSLDKEKQAIFLQTLMKRKDYLKQLDDFSPDNRIKIIDLVLADAFKDDNDPHIKTLSVKYMAVAISHYIKKCPETIKNLLQHLWFLEKADQQAVLAKLSAKDHLLVTEELLQIAKTLSNKANND